MVNNLFANVEEVCTRVVLITLMSQLTFGKWMREGEGDKADMESRLWSF
mgnify:CR=1 FL=1